MANRKKYVRLAQGEAMWRHEEAGINLTAFTTESIKNKKNLIAVEEIPKKFLPEVDAGVEAGRLEYVNKFNEKYKAAPSDKPSEPIVTEGSAKFKWTDDGKGKPGKVLRTPSYSFHSIGFDSEDSLHKKAFSILAGTPSKAVKDIKSIIATLDKKVDKLEFVEACYKIEKGGRNPSMHPRDVVMDYLSQVLNNLGETTGISSIKVEKEPIVKDKKPIRIIT